jgi:prepilin signal peptidase PulO-like enzyme (type II secretory pathway)
MPYVIAFVFWTIFGSLGSVLLSRLHGKVDWWTIKWILFWFSHCPHCKKRLQAENLIPLVSFFWQKGKCAFCKKTISWQYPLMEIASGLIFMFSYYLVFDLGAYMIPLEIQWLFLIFWCITHWGLLLLIIQDIKTQDLHMPIWIFTTLWVLVWQFLGLLGNYQWAVVSSLMFVGVTLLIYFGAKRYIQRKYHSNQEGFWQGDVYLWFLLGALIPFVEYSNGLEILWINHLKVIITIILLASILWLFYALLMFFMKTQTHIKIAGKSKITIPFFPTLIVAFWILLIWWNSFFSYFFF